MATISGRLESFSQDWAHNPAAMPDSRKFLIFGVMAFGQFMALFDIQIVKYRPDLWLGRTKSAGFKRLI